MLKKANCLTNGDFLFSGIFPQYSVVNEDDDLVSNDLSLVAPASLPLTSLPNDVVVNHVVANDVVVQQENPPPFKLTPRGHSAPVIISQVLFVCQN